LKCICAEQLQVLEQNDCFEKIPPFNPIASIQNTIELLALKKHLQKLNSDLKEEFKQIFEPIPHINDLPAHEPARIHVRDAYKKIALRSYPCPWQYKEAFATLIQKHLDSGFIHPSSSSFTSPSFFVPKKR
jgi:hypothetical protein